MPVHSTVNDLLHQNQREESAKERQQGAPGFVGGFIGVRTLALAPPVWANKADDFTFQLGTTRPMLLCLLIYGAPPSLRWPAAATSSVDWHAGRIHDPGVASETRASRLPADYYYCQPPAHTPNQLSQRSRTCQRRRAAPLTVWIPSRLHEPRPTTKPKQQETRS